jgi:hypothetical protein
MLRDCWPHAASPADRRREATTPSRMRASRTLEVKKTGFEAAFESDREQQDEEQDDEPWFRWRSLTL